MKCIHFSLAVCIESIHMIHRFFKKKKKKCGPHVVQAYAYWKKQRYVCEISAGI